MMLREVIDVVLPKVVSTKVNGEYTRIITLDAIMKAVAKNTNIPVEAIKGKEQKGEIVNARRIFCYIAKRRTKCSLTKIGDEIGKDHVTVLYHIKKISGWLEFNSYAKIYNPLFNKINMSI